MCRKTLPFLNSIYSEIYRYLRGNSRLCLLAILAVAEILVYTCLHTPPNNHYQQYVSATMPFYANMFCFIAIENLKSAIWLILFGTIPFGLGTLYEIFLSFQGLVATAKALLPQAGGKYLIFCILPHGLPEAFSLLLSIILSILLSKTITIAIFRLIRRQPVIHALHRELILIAQSILFVLVPIVFFAAAIEASISRYIVRLFM